MFLGHPIPRQERARYVPGCSDDSKMMNSTVKRAQCFRPNWPHSAKTWIFDHDRRTGHRRASRRHRTQLSQEVSYSPNVVRNTGRAVQASGKDPVWCQAEPKLFSSRSFSITIGRDL